MLRKLILSTILFLSFPQVAFSHGPGMPPFFLIDGKYADYYFGNTHATEIKAFTMPQDVGPENYLVNQPIVFKIDSTLLAIPEDVINNSSLNWDFGDGGKGTSLENTHTYTKIGSFVVTVHITTGGQTGSQEPQLLESVLINVLPEVNYTLPKAIIKVNNKFGVDPSKGGLDVDFGNLKFDATESKSSVKFAEYSWDFGDGKSSKQSIAEHQFDSALSFATVTLKVRDQNGFVSFSATSLRDSRTLSNTGSSQASNFLLPIGIATLVFLSSIYWIFLRRKAT